MGWRILLPMSTGQGYAEWNPAASQITNDRSFNHLIVQMEVRTWPSLPSQQEIFHPKV